MDTKRKYTFWEKAETELLIKNFPHMMSKELTKIIPSKTTKQINNKANALGLKKTLACRIESQEYINERMKKGGIKTRFKKGHVPMVTGNKEIAQKISNSIQQRIESERLRIKYGLKQLTKMNLK